MMLEFDIHYASHFTAFKINMGGGGLGVLTIRKKEIKALHPVNFAS